MCMNTLYGKTMAIWMLAGRPLAAIIFFLVGFLPDFFRNLRRIYREKRRVPIVHDDPIKPQGEYRLRD